MHTQSENIDRLDSPREHSIDSSKQVEIQNVITQDTPVKSKDNSEYIDNIIAYDREVQRISQSVHCNLDLGQTSLLRAQLQNKGRPDTHIKPPNVDIVKSIID